MIFRPQGALFVLWSVPGVPLAVSSDQRTVNRWVVLRSVKETECASRGYSEWIPAFPTPTKPQTLCWGPCRRNNGKGWVWAVGFVLELILS
jgi:hypothetical protein